MKMEVQYFWSIDEIKAYPAYAGNSNVICTVIWKLVGTHGNYNTQIQGSIDLPTEYLDPFTPYDQLTEEQVLKWVKDTMGPDQVTQYENGALVNLERIVNPPVVTLPLPWTL